MLLIIVTTIVIIHYAYFEMKYIFIWIAYDFDSRKFFSTGMVYHFINHQVGSETVSQNMKLSKAARKVKEDSWIQIMCDLS